MPIHKVDDTIPSNTLHSISVNLPTWQSAVDYVHDMNALSKEDTSNTKFKHGYPRVKLHPLVSKLCNVIREKYAKENESCLCFPSYNVAKRCREYIRFKSQTNVKVRILQLATSKPITSEEKKWKRECKIAVVFVKSEYYPILKEYWQLSGEIISSRAAEYVLHELFVLSSSMGRTTTSSTDSIKNNNSNNDDSSFIDKNLNVEFTDRAKKLIKKRITNNFVDMNEENDDSNYHFHENNSNSNLNATFLDSETSANFSNNNGSNNNNNNNNTLRDWDLNFEDGEEFQEIDETVTTTVTTGLNSMIPPEPIFADATEELNPGNDDRGVITRGNLHVRTESMSLIQEDDTRESLVDPEKDVFLFPSGMASLFTTLRLLLQFDLRRVNRTRSNASSNTSLNESIPTTNGNNTGTPLDLTNSNNSPISGLNNRTNNNDNSSNNEPMEKQGANLYKKTVMFGLPYSDTLKMLRTFNNTYFLPGGENESMAQLKKILHSGEQILAVFIEAPSNPLLKMGNLIELKELSDMFGFYIILDESIGSFVNIDGLQHTDIVCSSLTKIFSGETGTMAGTLILNPQSKIYSFAHEFLSELGEYEDNLWCKDLLVLERDSRDYVARTMKTNLTCEYILDNVIVKHEGGLFKKVYYPRFTSSVTKSNYEMIKCNEDSGYGNIFSITFHNMAKARQFYDSLEIYKGPSLGSTLTTASPYTILQYGSSKSELEDANRFGLDETLIRISIGCESRKTLCTMFQNAIDSAIK
ncbi:similar to Saccharomyces cerevisiae YML082W Putative protein predicted to have carbon-sulfur lyase activity [Maudiozyma barnettii]|uniref:Cystathionine gamma-synthase n=1 Tax=Maudiozyma barnettii TaxID=61262 RepID=A0A8H2VF74_9SACH|nr:putative cystathionine gamma-synthase [Kazachstania barnettii]CAB4254416.1 similar to Saccharomyces cerevisiae YML082W Putative protein predicted to have carbon-sulfur lyase activity [Kazachstania barnettii]CAD1782343.1 similar to Saccharomyces cerevisiae YML082W Putative protein predicted to have carbon-sulfur lyase activity [Kazachstania barnettii]